MRISVQHSGFGTALDMLCFPVKLLERWSLVGGVVGVLLGLGLIVVGWGLIVPGPFQSSDSAAPQWLVGPHMLGVGLAGGAIGVAYCFYGASLLVRREARLRRDVGLDDAVVPEPLTRKQLKSVLKTRKPPFFVCTRCRVVMEPGDCGGQCLRCGSETDCLPVDEDRDRRTVWSSVY